MSCSAWTCRGVGIGAFLGVFAALVTIAIVIAMEMIDGLGWKEIDDIALLIPVFLLVCPMIGAIVGCLSYLITSYMCSDGLHPQLMINPDEGEAF